MQCNTPPLKAIHKLIIRNQGLLSPSEIADFLCVTTETVDSWIEQLGLPKMEAMQRERAFPLVARCNHDLLTDEEIAALLRMPVRDYRKAVREMDFLDAKLGAKPENLDNGTLSGDRFDVLSARSFRARCERYFDDYSQWESSFSFVGDLSQEEPPFTQPTGAEPEFGMDLRMMYSYTATHGDFLLTCEDFYIEGILSRLRNRGVNAAWMPALLRDLAPSDVFPEFGEGHQIRLESLRKQVDKAAQYGINIYLYLNEPRYMPVDFFREYPEAKGMRAHIKGYYGMCTSDSRVREWLKESSRFLFSQVPELGGVVLVTASESETNCYSHVPTIDLKAAGVGAAEEHVFGLKEGDVMCPVCQRRGPQQVLTDTANLLHEGIRLSGANTDIIQWLWGWDYIMPMDSVEEAIGNLPDGTKVMVDWARYTHFNLFGKDGIVDEYTLAHCEPSNYAKRLLKAAADRGRTTLAKCALVSTAEMNALPYLPVMHNVEVLLKQCREHGVAGMLGCWIFGAYPGRNMEMLTHGDERSPARSLARKYYGAGAEDALAAWQFFSNGMSYFPSVKPVLYYSALNPGPGLRFSLEPEPWRFGMVAMATERIEEISGSLGADAMIKSFRRCAEYFSQGLERLRVAIGRSDKEEYREDNERDYGICKACMLHMLSAANYSEFILVRDNWLADQPNEALEEHLIGILRDELRNSEAMLELAKMDSRIGYEGSIGYFYRPIEIIEKIYDLESTIERLQNLSIAADVEAMRCKDSGKTMGR